MSRIPRIALVLWLVRALSLTAGTVPVPDAPPDHVVPAWYLGMPVIASSWEVVSMEERLAGRMPEGAELSTAYIVAPVSATSGVSPEREIQLPDRRVVLPAHQAVLTALHSPTAPVISVAWFVLAGPEATDQNLRTDPRPENGWASGPLARELRIGTEWVPLSSHVVIEYGLARNILSTEYFDGGALMWATPDWDTQRHDPAAAIHCTRPDSED